MYVAYRIDIRTAKFLEKFMISNNGICMMFELYAITGTNKIFSTYGNVGLVSDVRCAIDELFIW